MAVDESKWLYLLRVHIQEWKAHYNQGNQDLQELEDKHQRVRDQANPLNTCELRRLVAYQDQQVDDLINFYQSKRESIRERQQQELDSL